LSLLNPYIRSVAIPRLYRKNDNLLFQGEIPRSVTVIVDGIVKAYTITSDGEERITAIYGKGDVLPIAWAVGQAPNSLFYYEALNDVRTLQLTKKEFTKLIDESHDFRQAILGILGRNYAGILLRVTGLVQSRAIDKISYTLYYLMFRHGIEKKEGLFTLDVRLSQSTLADLIGQTRESTAKNLKVLKEKGIIHYSSSIYTINKSKLENFLGDDSLIEEVFI
jgi:CRP/FNR family transcriptional regulator, cyclic AMP receptor protein